MLKQRDTAPDVTLVQLDGVEVSLSALLARGTPVLLSFFKVSCPVCQYTFPFLNRLAVPGKLAVVGVSQNDEDATEHFGGAFGLDYPLLMDPDERGFKASNAFKITNVPSLFLVGPEGRIELDSTGFSRRDLEDIGRRFGVAVFRPDERTPDFRPG